MKHLRASVRYYEVAGIFRVDCSRHQGYRASACMRHLLFISANIANFEMRFKSGDFYVNVLHTRTNFSQQDKFQPGSLAAEP